MNYNFLNDKYLKLKKDSKIDLLTLQQSIMFNDNSFLLNHNIEAIEKIFKFLNTSENIFILNGFMGSGKTEIADYILEYINDDVLIFKNSYQEAINLDDVLLSLFKDFSVYHNKKQIILPKVESGIFSDKINSFIKYCDKPMLFIFDSFEINMRSKDTQKDILGFINYISKFEKVKILICSRSFREEDINNISNADTYFLSSLSKEEMSSYLFEKGISGSAYEVEDLYKSTRGHYLLMELSVLIMQLLDISLTSFSTEYKKSSKNFLEFLISKILLVSSEKFIKTLLFLTVIRHSADSKFLIDNNLATVEDLEFLYQKHIISENYGKYYIKDYVKNEYIKSINTETKIKVHEYLVHLYESELPLKPFDRKLFLSRQTMRQEIAFHKGKIDSLNEQLEKSSKQNAALMQGVNYLSYSKTSGYDEEMNTKKSKRYVKNIIKSSDKRNRFELSNEDSLLLNSVSSSNDEISKKMHEMVKTPENVDQETDEKNEGNDENSIYVPNTLEDFLQISQKYEEAYNYSNAILYYKKALTYKDDELYSIKEPVIYAKLAICYKKIQDFDTAINMYEKAYRLYIQKMPERANSILLAIAQIYNELYKFENAKQIYNRILYSDNLNEEMKIKVYLDLAELEDNNLDIINAIEYAKKALSEAEKINDIRILSECYFKYALYLDDAGKTDYAMKYYLRCVQISKDPEINSYLSSAYSNLAEIAFDDKNYSSAKMYFELSVEADKYQNNYEGLYYSYTKLAKLYQNEDSDKTYELLIKALSAAKHFDDITYVVAVYMEIGDYYVQKEDFKRALKSYILSKNLAPKQSDSDISASIIKKINKIKSILGEVEYIRLINEIKRKH